LRQGSATLRLRTSQDLQASVNPTISIQPSRDIHAEHPQDKSSREHVQVAQSRVTYQPEYSVEDSENDNDGNSIAGERTSIASEPHGLLAYRFPPSVGIGWDQELTKRV
jgi:hypothetical protein